MRRRIDDSRQCFICDLAIPWGQGTALGFDLNVLVHDACAHIVYLYLKDYSNSTQGRYRHRAELLLLLSEHKAGRPVPVHPKALEDSQRRERERCRRESEQVPL